MNLEIEGKKALVTGGSRGIGFAIAKRLAAEGCEVRLVARDAAALEAARARILAAGRAGVSAPVTVPVTVHAADLGDPLQLERVFPLLQDVDILVNSAGAVPRGTVFEVSAETFRAAFAAKVMGAIDLSREALRHMCARRSGVIVNIIGLSGERPNPRSVATSTANAALIAFTQAVGASSVDDNVRVLGVNPGLIATERTASLTDASDPVNSMAYRHLIEALPYGRMGTPEEVADVVAFLVSPRATYMSGTVVTVDAGSHFRV
jgi:3-oxoacyl-[acyl-carrier protein] reductase